MTKNEMMRNVACQMLVDLAAEGRDIQTLARSLVDQYTCGAEDVLMRTYRTIGEEYRAACAKGLNG